MSQGANKEGVERRQRDKSNVTLIPVLCWRIKRIGRLVYDGGR